MRSSGSENTHRKLEHLVNLSFLVGSSQGVCDTLEKLQFWCVMCGVVRQPYLRLEEAYKEYRIVLATQSASKQEGSSLLAGPDRHNENEQVRWVQGFHGFHVQSYMKFHRKPTEKLLKFTEKEFQR